MDRKAGSVKLLDEYLRIPTVSSQITPAMVELVREFWKRLGLDFELLWPSQPVSRVVNNPALYTEIPANIPDAPTLLLYGHWDVQPPGELTAWNWQNIPAPPFEPTYFREDKFLGREVQQVLDNLPDPADLGNVTLVARGSADNKGQHLANILGVLKARAEGNLKWQVKIILDGEEEVGSPNLGAIVQTHREKLKANFMVGSDGPKSDNRPTLLLGVRGLLGLVVRGKNQSGKMLHSGNYGNVIPNPVIPLTQLLSKMALEVQEMGQAGEGFREEIKRVFGKDDPDRKVYEPFLSPTFNINSLMTEGATTGQRRTIIPGWVEASIDVRLIPALEPGKVFERLKNLVDQANRERNPEGLEFTIELRSATAASYTSPEREGYRWLKEVIDRFWTEKVRVIPLLGGTLPNDVFTEGLGMASYWLPAANSNNRQHDTNEHFVLEHFLKQQDFYAALSSTNFVER